MQDRHVQTIRYKLQKRVRRLNSADHNFPFLLRVFFEFLDNSPLLSAVRDELMSRASADDIPGVISRIIKGELLHGTSEVESAAMGYLLLRKIAEKPDQDLIVNIGINYQSSGTMHDCLELIRAVFLEPFYEYVDEHLDDQEAILYSLRRYKHRCEWFHPNRLRRAVKDDTQRGEKRLADDLYEYLHGQGLDLHIEPHSISGIADFVADQVGKDRVIADAKLFWPAKGKQKAYILSGFHQVYTYACD